MDYGVIKGVTGSACYVVRLADGAIRPLLAAELPAFLSAGCVLYDQVLNADIAALQAVSPSW